MTKYVVNSGAVGKYREKAEKFFAEIVKDLGKNPKIVICLFAILRENWEEKFQEDLEEIPPYLPQGISATLELAMPDTFAQQVKSCDVVYIHGGDDVLVQYWLRQLNAPHVWEGKVVATNSASSDALAKYFWTGDWRRIMEGLGILPIKMLPHYQSNYGATDPRGPIDWEKAHQELAEYKEKDLPLYALEEGDFVVFTA